MAIYERFFMMKSFAYKNVVGDDALERIMPCLIFQNKSSLSSDRIKLSVRSSRKKRSWNEKLSTLPDLFRFDIIEAEENEIHLMRILLINHRGKHHLEQDQTLSRHLWKCFGYLHSIQKKFESIAEAYKFV